jgi:hypothetical protein
MNRVDAYRMVRRRAAEAGFKQKLGCHVFRATGITAYLEADGTLENAQAMAAHESPRTTSSTTAPAMRSRSMRSSGSRSSGAPPYACVAGSGRVLFRPRIHAGYHGMIWSSKAVNNLRP